MTILKYPITRDVLARQVYRISPQCFTIWLQDIDIIHRRTLSPADLRKIIRAYELPSDIEIRGI